VTRQVALGCAPKVSVAIVGGRLQGIEAVYLARKAGFRTVLLDRDATAPAFGLADEGILLDVEAAATDVAAGATGGGRGSSALAMADAVLRGCDFILPALENLSALAALERLAVRVGVPLIHSPGAYRVSCSKRETDALIARLGLPAPRARPEVGPYIVKPSGASGSAGVRRCETLSAAEAYAAELCALTGEPEAVIQEYVEGPSFSVEVIGRPGAYRTYALTEIHVDAARDCCLVTTPCRVDAGEEDAARRAPEAVAPCYLSAGAERRFREAAVTLAEEIGLVGIMDAEAIWDGRELRITEIDARLPSQTPAAILASTGVNFLAELAALTGAGGGGWRVAGAGAAGAGAHGGGGAAGAGAQASYAAYENILVDADGARHAGEHIMAGAGRLTLRQGFCGADESMTDWRAGCSAFRGIFINAADTPEELSRKRAAMVAQLEEALETGNAV